MRRPAAFVKQHSVLDIPAALPVCAPAERFAFFRKKGAQKNG